MTNTAFDLNSFTPCEILVENITSPNIQPQGNISQTFDIKSNIVHSAPATVISSFSPLVEGILSDDSFVVNDALPSQNGVEGTYTFMYDRDLDIGDTIELTLPGWGGSGLTTFQNVWSLSIDVFSQYINHRKQRVYDCIDGSWSKAVSGLLYALFESRA